MSLSVLKPAPVTLPSYLKNIAVVNRSLPVRKTRIFDAADKIVTLEGANLDKAGSNASVASLANELSRNRKIASVKILDEPALGNNVPSMYPTPLSWDEVEKICSDNHTDALFSLELFDTDSKISYAAYPVKLNTPLGKIPIIEQEATMLTRVKAGWRIYDPKERFVLDEFAVSKQIKFTGRGINPVIAANAIIGRKEAVKEVGSRAGQGYAFRVLPFWIRVNRYYFVRGTNNFRIAKRKAQTGNWDEAGDLWYKETNNAKSKVAGRACYNMAIISEINGNPDEAMRWAQKAYEDYNNKLALKYVKILEYRKLNDDILKDQQSDEVAGNR